MWPFTEIRRLRAELDREREARHSAENQLVLIVASIQREEDLADVRRRMELHAKHLDLVEGRNDAIRDEFRAGLAKLTEKLARLSKRKIK